MDGTWSADGEAGFSMAETAWENFYGGDANSAIASHINKALSGITNMNIFSSQVWHEGNVEIVRYQPAPAHPSSADQDLMRKFPRPDAPHRTFFPATETSQPLARDNYQTKFKDLLFAEENAQQQYIQWYNHACSPKRLQPGGVGGRAEILFSDVLTTKIKDIAGGVRPHVRNAIDGELFGTVNVSVPIKPDTPWGRLMGRDVTTAFLASVEPVAGPVTVYEVRVVHRKELSITFLCPAAFVEAFALSPSESRVFCVQFLLDRVGFVQQLESIDRQVPSNISRLFASPEAIASMRTLLHNTYKNDIDALPMPHMKQELNPLQRIAIRTFLALDLVEEKLNKCMYTPPMLVVGPFGTGKTHTLAECVRQLLYADDRRSVSDNKPANLIDCDKLLNHQRPTRVLVCTNSNSAADLYMLNFLPDIEQIRAFRVYALTRFMTPQIMQYAQYTNQNPDPINADAGFVIPTHRDLDDKRVVITTLNATSSLCHPLSDLPYGFFTHIIIDEAAQITEPTCIVPLRLVSGATKILLAGDPLQSNPRVYSEFCMENELHKSLLERLFNLYKKNSAETPSNNVSRENSVDSAEEESTSRKNSTDQTSPNKPNTARRYSIGRAKRTNSKKLNEVIKQQQQCPFVVVLSSNYRSHRDICRLMSELLYTKYYGRAVEAANEQVLQHPVCPPLMFISCDDSADVLSNGSYFNDREVQVVCDMVNKIIDDWPEGEDAWGPVRHEQVAVVTPYMEQVKAVRNVLRDRGLGGVTVESVNNVQGRQFRAIIMSCVRTKATLKYTPYELMNEENTDLGYLSDVKMVNTVITRAQSLVCIVGSAVDLLAYGKCQKMWHKFLKFCVDPDFYAEDKYARDKSAAAMIREKLSRKIQWNLKAPEFLPAFLSELKKNGGGTDNESVRARLMDFLSSEASGTEPVSSKGESLSTNTPFLTPPNSGGAGGATPPFSASVKIESFPGADGSLKYVPQVVRDKAGFGNAQTGDHGGSSSFPGGGQVLGFPPDVGRNAAVTDVNNYLHRFSMPNPYSMPNAYSGPNFMPMSPIFGTRPPRPISSANSTSPTRPAAPLAQPAPSSSSMMPPAAPQLPTGYGMDPWSYYYKYIISYMQAVNTQQQYQNAAQQQAAAQQQQYMMMMQQQQQQQQANAYRQPFVGPYGPQPQFPVGPRGVSPGGAAAVPMMPPINPYAPRGLPTPVPTGGLRPPFDPPACSSSSSTVKKEIDIQQLQAALLLNKNADGPSSASSSAAIAAAVPVPEVDEPYSTSVVFHSLGKVKFTGDAAVLVKQNFSVAQTITLNNQMQGNSAECLCSYCGTPLRLQSAMGHLEKAHRSEYAVIKAVKHPPMMFFGYLDHDRTSQTVKPRLVSSLNAAAAGDHRLLNNAQAPRQQMQSNNVARNADPPPVRASSSSNLNNEAGGAMPPRRANLPAPLLVQRPNPAPVPAPVVVRQPAPVAQRQNFVAQPPQRQYPPPPPPPPSFANPPTVASGKKHPTKIFTKKGPPK